MQKMCLKEDGEFHDEGKGICSLYWRFCRKKSHIVASSSLKTRIFCLKNETKM